MASPSQSFPSPLAFSKSPVLPLSPIPMASMPLRTRVHNVNKSIDHPSLSPILPNLPLPPKAVRGNGSPMLLHSPRLANSPRSPNVGPPNQMEGIIHRLTHGKDNSLKPPAPHSPTIPATSNLVKPDNATRPADHITSEDRTLAPPTAESIPRKGSFVHSSLLDVLRPGVTKRRTHRRNQSNVLISPSIDITRQFAVDKHVGVEPLNFLAPTSDHKRAILGEERMETKLRKILMPVTPRSALDEDERFQDAPEQPEKSVAVLQTLDAPFNTPPQLRHRRRFSPPLQSIPSHPTSSEAQTATPIGLGILSSSDAEGVIGLGIREEVLDAESEWEDIDNGEHLTPRGLVPPGGGFGRPRVYSGPAKGIAFPDLIPDPPSPPALATSSPVSPRRIKLLKKKPARLPSSQGISLPGAFPRRSHRKRIYPHPAYSDPAVQIKSPFSVEVRARSPLPTGFSVHDTPDLSGLPGSFISSPVLPTSFSDFGHSPLPTPPMRFARLRKNLPAPPPQFSAPSPAWNSSTSSSLVDCSTTSSALSVSTPVFRTPMPSSPVGTPTLTASPAFATSVASDAERSAPSTPVPEAHASAFSAAANASSSATAGQASDAVIFDVAITSTIIGAIVCLGAVTWLAFSMLRRRKPRHQERLAIGKPFHYDYDEKPSSRMPQISYPQPQAPPLARLAFQRSPEPFRGEDLFGGAWVDDEPIGGSGRSTEDHGGYPEMIMRGDGASLLQRRASAASVASRTSQVTSSTRPVSRRRASQRTSAGSSIADSTFSRSSIIASSRTSHGISPTPPRIPSPVGIRYSSDPFFSTPPETPTKNRWAPSSPEPPVPVLPLDFREFGAPPPSPPRSRSRTSFRTTSSGKVSRSSKVNGESSSGSVKARKLQKRRATIDGTILRGGKGDARVLLFQSQLDNPPMPVPKLDGRAADLISSAPFSSTSEAEPKPLKSALKKPRPVTMPPAIVVSDHPQELVPPSSPVKAPTPSDPAASPSSDTRASVKTFQTMPWLRQSPSATSGWTANFPRDDCSILDPDMRSQRNDSIDTTRFSVETLMRSSTSPSNLRAAATRKTEEDRGSITSGEHSELDTEDEQNLRNQRRKTLLYSVYQQRGVNIPPPAPIVTSPAKSMSGTDSGSTVDTMAGKVTKRQSIVLSFPTPPENDEDATPSTSPPTSSNKERGAVLESALTRFSASSFDLEYDIEQFQLDRIASSESLRALARSKTYDTVATARSETDIASVFCSPDEDEEFIPSSPLPPLPSSPAPPPRPAKSASRTSGVFDSTTSSPTTSPSPSRIPVSSRTAPTRYTSTTSPFANLATSSAPRSFAADLQASVGSPATGYDSDTLLSNLNNRKPYSAFTASLYSTHSASIESLEEAAISRGESVHFGGRGMASGIPRRSVLQSTGIGRRSVGYDSDESTYDDSETESLDFGSKHLSTVLERDGF